MTTYEYLCEKQRTGELSIMFQLGLPTRYIGWMDIYAYHLAHPGLSQFQIALHFGTCMSVVWEAYHRMNQPIGCRS